MKLTNYKKPVFTNTKFAKKMWSKKRLIIIHNLLTNDFDLYRFKKYTTSLTYHLIHIHNSLTFQEIKDYANEMLIDK